MQIGAMSSGVTGAAVMQVAARTSRSTDLSIVTAEGDRVTLSSSITRALGYAGAVGCAGSPTVTAGALQVNGSDSLSVSVEGDLSREELVDLQKVIKAFRHASARGDASKLLDRLSRPDLDTIASVAGSVSTEATLSATLLAQ